MWESHAAPELAGRAQQIINDRLLINADALIGIFWTRIGTPTGAAESGTLEEIQEHHARGRPVHLYFSNRSFNPGDVDEVQYEDVRKAREWAQNLAITWSFDSPEEFRRLLTRQLHIMLRTPYFKRVAKPLEDYQHPMIILPEGLQMRRALPPVSSPRPPSPPTPPAIVAEASASSLLAAEAASTLEQPPEETLEISPFARELLHSVIWTEDGDLIYRQDDRGAVIIEDGNGLFAYASDEQVDKCTATFDELVKLGFMAAAKISKTDTRYTLTAAGRSQGRNSYEEWMQEMDKEPEEEF